MSTYRPSRLLALAIAALTAAVLAVVGVVVASPASAAESWTPVNGQFALVGHGYGHGRGMSQWGAYGAATDGRSAAQILDFYYPGTTGVPTFDTMVRARLTADEGQDLAVEPNSRTGSLGIVDTGSIKRDMPLPASVGGAPVAMWRARWSGGVTRLEGLWGGGWQAYPVGAPWVTDGPLEYVSSSGTMTIVYPGLTRRDYHGSLKSVPNGSRIISVNLVPREQYLRSVVPAESPSSWPPAALQAQAVAARSYFESVRTPSGPYDICDSEACQVYLGMASYDSSGRLLRTYEATSTDDAIKATAGVVRTYNGAPVFAQFSSTNGGWSVAGGKPYLVAQPDPYDRPQPWSYHDWTATVSAAQLASVYGTGTVQSLSVNSRDGNGEWGGRVQSVTIRGTSGSVTVSGDSFRSAANLRSTWWTVSTPSAPDPDVSAVLTSGGQSGALELHTLSWASGYSSFSQHVATALGQVNKDDWRFFVAPYPGSGPRDLYAVKLRGTDSGRVEVHVLSQASGYQTWVAHEITAQPQVPVGLGLDVALGSWGGDGLWNLFLVQSGASSSGKVEVHVLSAASRWSTFLTHAATALPLSAVKPGEWSFLAGGPGGAGDLVGVWHSGSTGSGATEVHTLTRASGYTSFSQHVATPLALSAPNQFSFALADDDRDGVPDLYALKRTGTSSSSTEVHVLSGSTGFGSWLLHTATPLNQTGTAWQLDAR